MTTADELTKLNLDIENLADVLESSNLRNRARLEGELERMLQYRHKLILRLKHELEEIHTKLESEYAINEKEDASREDK